MVAKNARIGLAEVEIAKINKKLDKGPKIVKSNAQEEEEQLNYDETLLQDQLDHIKGKGSSKEVDNMCGALTKIRKEEFNAKRIAGDDYDREEFND